MLPGWHTRGTAGILTEQAKKKNTRHREDFPLCVFFAKNGVPFIKKHLFTREIFFAQKCAIEKNFVHIKGSKAKRLQDLGTTNKNRKIRTRQADPAQKKKGIVFAKAKERKKRWKDRTLQ